MTLQPTYGYFEAIGKVTGINNDRAYHEGNKNNVEWNRLQFGLKVSKNAFVYVELMGNKTDRVRMYKNYSNDDLLDNKYEMVRWDDIYKHQFNKLKLPQSIKTNVGLQKDEEKMLIAYDAVNYFKDKLHCSKTVLVKGLLQFDKYDGKTQEKFYIRSLYEVDEDMYEDSMAKAYFTQEIVFVGINDNQISSKIIKGNKSNLEVIEYNFTTNSKETIDYLSNLEPGSTIRLHGDIKNYVPIELISGYEIISGPAVRELQVTGGNSESLVRGRYSVLDLANKTINTSPFDESEENEFGF